jgi:large subunit ribosomal protein L17
MRHLHAGRKLGVSPSHRKALLRSLSLAIIEHEEIQTTPARAKELRWFAERMVTLGKRGDLAARRHVIRLLGSTQTYKTGNNRVRKAVDKVFTSLAPRFKTRQGGYTQIVRLAKRRMGDNAELCIMRYLPGEGEAPSSKKEAKATPKAKKASAKPQAKAAPADKEPKARKTSSKKES